MDYLHPMLVLQRGFNVYKQESFQSLEELPLSIYVIRVSHFLVFYSERFLTCLKIPHRFSMKIWQISIFRHMNKKIYKIYKML